MCRKLTSRNYSHLVAPDTLKCNLFFCTQKWNDLLFCGMWEWVMQAVIHSHSKMLSTNSAHCNPVDAEYQQCSLQPSGCWVPTVLTVTQWMLSTNSAHCNPVVTRIWTDSSLATLKLRVCSRSGFCNKPTFIGYCMGCGYWAAWFSLSFSHLCL